MMPPNAMSVAQVSRDTGISDVTLYNWRNRFRHKGQAVPADPSNPENWSGENKLAVVIESTALNAEELAEYCRQKGLYVEQIAHWREAAAAGAATQRPSVASFSRNVKRTASWQRNSGARTEPWPRQLHYWFSKKKAQAIWGGEEDD